MKIPKPTPLRPPPRTQPKGFRMTGHATARAAEMKLTMDEIVALVETPDDVQEHGAMSKYRDTSTILHVRGEHAAVLDTERRTIVTILWRYKEGYLEHGGEGREARPWTHLPSRHEPACA